MGVYIKLKKNVERESKNNVGFFTYLELDGIDLVKNID